MNEEPREVAANSSELAILSCEKEELKFTGSIQGHGIFFALDNTYTVIALSENAAELGFPATSFLQKRFFDLFLELEVLQQDLDQSLLFVPTLLTRYRWADRLWNIVSIAHSDGYFLEWELAGELTESGDGRAPTDETVYMPQEFVHIEESYSHLLSVLNGIIHFDHVMLYRFLKDYSGEVVAEVRRDGGPAYLGHRFPATDIPKIARDLYVQTLYRMIGSVDAPNFRLLSLSSTPLDLTHSYLRSVSPVHIEYLRNMGVVSSVSFPVLANKQLWGLIACHHYRPRVVPFGERWKAIEAVNNFAITLRTQQIMEENTWRIDVEKKLLQIARGDSARHERDKFHAALYEGVKELLELCGMVLVEDGKVWTLGQCPSQATIEQLLESLGRDRRKSIYASEYCGQDFGQLPAWPRGIGGLIIAQSHYLEEERRWKYGLIGFRAEVTQWIKWAGPPQKITSEENAMQSLHPRASFATWMEKRRGSSREWSNLDRFRVRKVLNFAFRREP